MQIHTKCLKIKRNVSSTHEIHIIQQVKKGFGLLLFFQHLPFLTFSLHRNRKQWWWWWWKRELRRQLHTSKGFLSKDLCFRSPKGRFNSKFWFLERFNLGMEGGVKETAVWLGGGSMAVLQKLHWQYSHSKRFRWCYSLDSKQFRHLYCGVF